MRALMQPEEIFVSQNYTQRFSSHSSFLCIHNTTYLYKQHEY